MKTLVVAAVACAVLLSGCHSDTVSGNQAVAGATAAPTKNVPTVMTEQADGRRILVAGVNGLTLYTFDLDKQYAGKSNCSGMCRRNWPPLLVFGKSAPTAGAGVTGTLGTIDLGDGTSQVTYDGWPLYFFHLDRNAGDTKGQVTDWKVATP